MDSFKPLNSAILTSHYCGALQCHFPILQKWEKSLNIKSPDWDFSRDRSQVLAATHPCLKQNRPSSSSLSLPLPRIQSLSNFFFSPFPVYKSAWSRCCTDSSKIFGVQVNLDFEVIYKFDLFSFLLFICIWVLLILFFLWSGAFAIISWIFTSCNFLVFFFLFVNTLGPSLKLALFSITFSTIF